MALVLELVPAPVPVPVPVPGTVYHRYRYQTGTGGPVGGSKVTTPHCPHQTFCRDTSQPSGAQPLRASHTLLLPCALPHVVSHVWPTANCHRSRSDVAGACCPALPKPSPLNPLFVRGSHPPRRSAPTARRATHTTGSPCRRQAAAPKGYRWPQRIWARPSALSRGLRALRTRSGAHTLGHSGARPQRAGGRLHRSDLVLPLVVDQSRRDARGELHVPVNESAGEVGGHLGMICERWLKRRGGWRTRRTQKEPGGLRTDRKEPKEPKGARTCR